MIGFWNWLLLGVAVFLLMGMLSVWSDAAENCAEKSDGVVVRNFWGWPTCVGAGE